MRFSPGRERRAQLRVGRDAAGERRGAGCPRGGARSSTRSSRAATIACWKEARRSTSSGSRASGVERRAVDAAPLELAQHRGLQAREGEVERAVLHASDRQGEAARRRRARRCGRRPARPDSRGPPAGRPCRRPRPARRRACGRAERSRSGSTRTSSAWPPETTSPWNGMLDRARPARPRRRRNAEKRCPSRWLTPTNGTPRAKASALPAERPTSSGADQARPGGRRDRGRRPASVAPAPRERLVEDRGQVLQVRAGRDLRDDAAVARVRLASARRRRWSGSRRPRRRGRRPRSRRRRSRCRERSRGGLRPSRPARLSPYGGGGRFRAP